MGKRRRKNTCVDEYEDYEEEMEYMEEVDFSSIEEEFFEEASPEDDTGGGGDGDLRIEELGYKIDFHKVLSPKLVDLKNLWQEYPEGKAIAYRKLHSDVIEVYDEADLDPNILNPDLYKVHYQLGYPEHESEVTVDLVPKINPNMMGLNKSLSLQEFYQDKDQYILMRANMLKKVHHAEDKKLNLWVLGLNEAKYNDQVILYGISSTHVSMEERRNITSFINIMSYRDYLQKQQELLEEEKVVNSFQKQPMQKDADIMKTALEDPLLPPVCYEIRKFLATTTFEEFVQEISAKYVIGQPELEKFLFYVWQYLCNCAKGNIPLARNVLLAAPSGAGKTQTYRGCKEYFKKKIPSLAVIIFDSSSLTSAGYKGSEVRNIYSALFQNAHYSVNKGIGCLVFLDEIDKLALSAAHATDKFKAEALDNMLVMLEGQRIYEDKDREYGAYIDTSECFFVGTGSFAEIRHALANKRGQIGYGVATSAKSFDHYDIITREDMINYSGGANEFFARFINVISYGKLSEKAVNLVINKLLYEISAEMNHHITITVRMRKYLQSQANTELGCRRLESIIRDAIVRYCLSHKKKTMTGRSVDFKLDISNDQDIDNCISK